MRVMRVILFAMATLISLNVAMARPAAGCKVNVYKPDVGPESEIALAETLKQILIQKGYEPVEDNSGTLTHSTAMAGFGEIDCTLSAWGMKRITAYAAIYEGAKILDYHTADDSETANSCAKLHRALVSATEKLKSCPEL